MKFENTRFSSAGWSGMMVGYAYIMYDRYGPYPLVDSGALEGGC
jgi:hypothetical protein